MNTKPTGRNRIARNPENIQSVRATVTLNVGSEVATLNLLKINVPNILTKNGSVHKQNCRYWYFNNPKEKQQKLLHSPKVTVWAGKEFSKARAR